MSTEQSEVIQTRPRSNTQDITPPEAVDTRDDEMEKAEQVLERGVEGKADEPTRMSLGQTHSEGTRSRSGSIIDKLAEIAGTVKDIVVEGKDIVVEKTGELINRLRSESVEKREDNDLSLSVHHDVQGPSHLVLYFTTLHQLSPEKQKAIIEGRKKSGAQNSAQKTQAAQPAATPAPAAQPAKPAASEDDFDLFGDETEEEAAAREAREEEIEVRAKEALEKSKNKGVVLKSAIVIDVKPWDDTTDMKDMEERVRSITMEGLEWKAGKLTEIGYGIKKLQISCHVVDDLVSVDDICEKIQEFEDLVQSTDVSTFTKL